MTKLSDVSVASTLTTTVLFILGPLNHTQVPAHGSSRQEHIAHISSPPRTPTSRNWRHQELLAEAAHAGDQLDPEVDALITLRRS